MNTAHTLHARCVCTLYARRVLQVGVLCGVALGACVKEPRNAQRALVFQSRYRPAIQRPEYAGMFGTYQTRVVSYSPCE